MAVPLKPADAVAGSRGHILVADRSNKFVAELDGSGARCGCIGTVSTAPSWRSALLGDAGGLWQGRQCVLIADAAGLPR